MDPVATLCAFLESTSNDERQELAEAWRGWLHKGGFRPLAFHVKGEWEKRGHRWTRRHHILCLMFGAI